MLTQPFKLFQICPLERVFSVRAGLPGFVIQAGNLKDNNTLKFNWLVIGQITRLPDGQANLTELWFVIYKAIQFEQMAFFNDNCLKSTRFFTFVML